MVINHSLTELLHLSVAGFARGQPTEIHLGQAAYCSLFDERLVGRRDCSSGRFLAVRPGRRFGRRWL